MNKYQFSPVEKSVMEKSGIPFAVYQFIDKRVVTLVLSEGFCKLFDLTKEEAYHLMDNDMYRDAHPDDAGRIADAAYRFATDQADYNVVYRTRVKDHYIIIHSRGEHFHPVPDVRLAIVWYMDEGLYEADSKSFDSKINPAFNRALMDETLEHRYYYDNLTGLPTMTGFFIFAQAGRQKLRNEGLQPAIVFFNLNGMKFYNRRNGFHEGDKLLRGLSRILADTFGNENCSRFSMDIFAVVTGNQELESKLRYVFDESKKINDGNSLTVRAGIALDTEENLEISMICDRAKYACDLNRGNFYSGFAYFNDSMLMDIEKHQYVIDNIDRAIAERWIQVYYQPIVRTANGRICDEEALARWIDPFKGFMTPADFISPLENASLIYKLDLYMVDEVLNKMKRQANMGLFVVPISVNLSRTDFDACDIVEEIRHRVDAAGISRDKLTIEITESVIGSDFDFMKQQVQRFQNLGFKVWMDDFGSGYSSLDVLQNIHFDLIKFDMHFMQQFDDGEDGKIILTELMKMAIGLGLDTLCEGVEKQEQVDFLREVGCTKIQGYYYGKPIPMDQIFDRYEKGFQIGFENLEETDYYSAIGRINLYDMALIAREDQESFRNYFDTLPIAILESSGDTFWLQRCNQSFREFMIIMGWNFSAGKQFEYELVQNMPGLAFMKIVRQCGVDGNRVIIDDVMPNGLKVHAFIKRIAVNPVTGTAALAIAVLGVTDNNQSGGAITYSHIAQALSMDYVHLFYVNMETGNYTQYSNDGLNGGLSVEKHGDDFFADSARNSHTVLYANDVDFFNKSFSKEQILKALNEKGAFTLTYRQLSQNKPVYVNMKAVRLNQNDSNIIIGVSNVNSQMKQKEELEHAKQEQLIYSRLKALSGDLICLYIVDPETEYYTEYSSSDEYDLHGIPKEGDHFFDTVLQNVPVVVYEEDIERFYSLFSREKVMESIQMNNFYGLRYRMMSGGEPRYVSLKAVMAEENNKKQLIIGINDIDARLKRDHEYERNKAIANARHNLDRLTGVKNRHAYEIVLDQLNEQINERRIVEFAIAVFGMRSELNITELRDPQEEKEWIKKAAVIIGSAFKRSPLFRIDNDIFVIIAQGLDYQHFDSLVQRIYQINEKNRASGEITIPMGTAVYGIDPDAESVYDRAVSDLTDRYRNSFS